MSARAKASISKGAAHRNDVGHLGHGGAGLAPAGAYRRAVHRIGHGGDAFPRHREQTHKVVRDALRYGEHVACARIGQPHEQAAGHSRWAARQVGVRVHPFAGDEGHAGPCGRQAGRDVRAGKEAKNKVRLRAADEGPELENASCEAPAGVKLVNRHPVRRRVGGRL